ncbi:AI-2E family transporter [Bryobacterales bacterium F-183]|nr:AI-2E family transporter [Bryobacterales bacterium F-183]
MQRQHLSSGSLIAIAVVSIVICVLLAAPFVPPLTWALALSIGAAPLHRRILQRMPDWPSIAAGLTVVILVVGLLAPAILVGRQVAREANHGYQVVQGMVASGEFEASMKRHPKVAEWVDWARENVSFEEEAKHAASWVGGWFQGSVVAVSQLVVAQFFVFFMLRDQAKGMQTFRGLMPLSPKEADEVLRRVAAMVRATLYGTLFVGSIQGFLGGTMFWLLGIPAALLWGCIMALMSLVPSLGSFLIWAPVAGGLALQGNWGKASILTAWGLLVVSTIDNILYPILVGKEIQIHPTTVFVATLGGLIWLGAPGIILGPVCFAFATAILEVIRNRTVGSRAVEEAVS